MTGCKNTLTPPPARRWPLNMLTEQEIADYELLKVAGGYSRREALASIGRLDVLEGAP